MQGARQVLQFLGRVSCCAHHLPVEDSPSSDKANEAIPDGATGFGFVVTEHISVAVTKVSGERLEFPLLPASLPLSDLKERVKEQWGLPVVAQRLMHGTQLLADEDGTTIGQALRGLVEGEGEIVELSCVRDAIPKEVQGRLDATLLCATASGDYTQMTHALSEGARPGESGLTCMMIALAARDEKTCDILQQAGAVEPDMKPTLDSLGHAFQRHDFAEVVRLLYKGADPNTILLRGQGIRATNSGTALHACCALHAKPEATALVHLLCRLGANTTAPDAEGDSPLSHARYFGADDIYRVLQSRGAKLQGPFYRYRA